MFPSLDADLIRTLDAKVLAGCPTGKEEEILISQSLSSTQDHFLESVRAQFGG